MPRHRRIIEPGDLVHVISRIVDGQFRIRGPEERFEYLRRLGERLEESDWRLISYAVMSSHTHAGLIAGREPFERIWKSVYSPFASWLNRRESRLGPVFANRPDSFVVDPVWTGQLVAYQHNNPPRAGVVNHAAESDWTSHQAYMGIVSAPDWLAVELGLALMDFSNSRAGRQAFERYVRQREWAPRELRLTGDIAKESRHLREQLQASVSVAHPRTGPAGTDYSPMAPALRWHGDMRDIIDLVAKTLRVFPLRISSSSRDRTAVAGRRLVTLIGHSLGLTNQAIGLALGISEAGVRKLRRGADEKHETLARALTETLTQPIAPAGQ